MTASERERADFQRLRPTRITKMAYGGAQYLSLKKEAMTIWTNTLLDEYERQKAKALPSLKPPSDLHPIPVPDRFSTSGTGCKFSVSRPIILRRRNQPRELRTLLVIIVTFKMQSMTRLDRGPHDVSSRQPQNPLDVLHHSLSCRPHSATRLSSPVDRHNPPAAHRLLHREPRVMDAAIIGMPLTDEILMITAQRQRIPDGRTAMMELQEKPSSADLIDEECYVSIGSATRWQSALRGFSILRHIEMLDHSDVLFMIDAGSIRISPWKCRTVRSPDPKAYCRARGTEDDGGS